MSDAVVTREDIVTAAGRIEPYVRHTPTFALGDVLGAGYDLTLKLDHMQPTGSFKVRGAFSALTAISIPISGVVAASGGNFGLAVAYAARELGHTATIFVPDTSPHEKVGKIERLGARLVVVPGFYGDALAASRQHASEDGSVSVHAYDQAEVMAGQGTCGREILDQVPDASTILVAVGGGGLIGGIASWTGDRARIVAVESEECPTLHEARRAGRPIDVEIRPGSATSSLGASRIGDIPWSANRWIDESVLVSDPEILAAQSWLWDTTRIVAEPSGCVPIAALRSGAVAPEKGEQVVALISGANTAIDLS